MFYDSKGYACFTFNQRHVCEAQRSSTVDDVFKETSAEVATYTLSWLKLHLLLSVLVDHKQNPNSQNHTGVTGSTQTGRMTTTLTSEHAGSI